VCLEKTADLDYDEYMNAAQKECIYTFLKTAADSVYGAHPGVFDGFPSFEDDPEAEDSAAAIARIAGEIASCNACSLCRTRISTVSGMGVAHPLVMVVGEAPGKDEDEQGLPFVGAAGKLLDSMLNAISLSRTKNCFIANTIKCRPPANRDPLPEETQACAHFLDRQIDVLAPKAILVAGRLALQRMLGGKPSITNMHGRFFDYKGIPLLPIFHPSYLLRDPAQKKPAWSDLQKFRLKLRELAPDYEQESSS
jgi:DNA polymerase